jgi:cobalt-zinc-cadmium efflux system outer membrane protein
MSRILVRRVLPLTLAIAAGCESMKPGLGFDDVRQSVGDRTGMKVHWNTGSDEDAEAASAVSGLLGRDLSADAAVQIGLLNNHELQAVYQELNLAQADLVQAGLLRNPIFSGEIRWATTGSDGPGVVLDLTQDFVSLFYLPLRRGRAEAAFEAAKVRVTAAVVDMAADVRSAFYEYQAAEQTREMRRTVLSAAQASYDLATRLRAAGNNRELDVLNERDLFEQAKLDLAQADSDVIEARERLNALMGVWGKQTQWRAEALLPALPDEHTTPEDLERIAIERSLDLALARRDIEIEARALGIAKPFGWLTDAEVGVAAEREIEGDWSVGPSVSVPVPLFDQGQGAIAKAQAQLRQASERYYARAVEVRSRVRAANAVVSSAHDRARYYRMVVLPLRQQIVDQTQLQYNAMQVSAFQLLQAKRDQIEAGASYIGALRDYWIARTRLEQIVSGRLTPFEGIADPSSSPSTGPEQHAGGSRQSGPTDHRPTASPE